MGFDHVPGGVGPARPIGGRLASLRWGAALTSPGEAQGEHPLHVPGQSHEAPLAADGVEPTQQKLAEPQHRFDDAKHRLRSLFAQRIELLAFGRPQAMGHGLYQGWMVRRRPGRGEALVQGGMMMLNWTWTPALQKSL